MSDRAGLPVGVRRRWILARHGPVDPSSAGTCYGRTDVDLDPSELSHLRRVAEAFSDTRVDVVRSSPSTRALRLANAIATRIGLAVEIDPRLAELDFGAFEGRAFEELRRSEPDVFDRWMRHPTDVVFPGGEGFVDLRRRVDEAMREVRRSNATVIVLCTHAGVIRSVLATALGMPTPHVFRLQVDPASLSCVDEYDDGPVVRFVGRLPPRGR